MKAPRTELHVKCARCVGGAIGTRLELYRALWRERLDGQWECDSHRRKGDAEQFKTFHHERGGTPPWHARTTRRE